MKNFEAPWLTFSNDINDPNYMGEIEELNALNQRVDALDRALKTGKNFDILLDMLAEHGQDPNEYVEQVQKNIEITIAQNLVPEDLFYWAKRL